MEFLHRFEITNNQNPYLRQLEWNSKISVATSLERVHKLQIDSELKLYCFNHPNNIYEYSLKILMKRNFPLVNELNRFIQFACNGGLTVKWLKGNQYTTASEKPPIFSFSEANLNSLIFGGIIFSTVLILSLIVFAIENITHRNVQGNKFQTFWRLLQMLIDPYRYFLLEDLSH